MNKGVTTLSISFRKFRLPYSPKPVSWLRLFFAASYSKTALVLNLQEEEILTFQLSEKKRLRPPGLSILSHFQKNKQNHCSSTFPPAVKSFNKTVISGFWEDGTKLKILSEIQPPLNVSAVQKLTRPCTRRTST